MRFVAAMLIAILALESRAQGQPELLFSRPAASLVNLTGVSAEFYNRYGFPDFAYTSCSVPKSAWVTEIRWYGFYHLDGAPIDLHTVEAWGWDVREDLNGLPGQTLTSGFANVHSANETRVGEGQYESTKTHLKEQQAVFSYRLTMPKVGTQVGFLMTAGKKYWCSVHPALRFRPYWGWLKGASTGSAKSYSTNCKGFDTHHMDLALELYGVPATSAP